MLTFLLIIYCLLFIFLALKNFNWALYLVIFTLPAYLIRFNIIGLPSTLLEIEIVLLTIIFLIKNYPGYSRLKISHYPLHIARYTLFYYFITLLIITSTAAVFISPHTREALGLWKAYFIEPIIFFFIFIKTIKKEELKNIFYILSAQVFLLSILAIYQKFTGAFIANPFWAAEATRRVTSVFPYPNALALYLAPIVTLLIGLFVLCIMNNVLWIKNKKYHPLVVCLLLIIIIFSFLAIYFTHSKGALLGILAGLIFYAIFFKPYRKYFIIILIIIPLILYSFNPSINLRGNATVIGGDSISTRLDMWSETWQMLQQKPLFGAGLAGYQDAVAQFHKKSYIEIYLYPHNIFLNFWSEIGLLGLLAFLGIIIWFYKFIFSLKKNNLPVTSYQLPVILASTMTTLLVHGLVDVPYFKNDLAMLFWLIIGLLIINKTNIKTIPNTIVNS